MSRYQHLIFDLDGTLIDSAPAILSSFREAFAFSSNICFAKLSQRLSREQLFGTLQDLGFGNSTGVLLPGELEGVLRAASFMGLGVCLIGIGLFYQRVLGRAKAPIAPAEGQGG